MEIEGVSWQNEDGSWCLEVSEETYRDIMGDENWGIEKSVRRRCPGVDMPYTIQMDDLLAEYGVMYGNKVRLTIEIEKIKSKE